METIEASVTPQARKHSRTQLVPMTVADLAPNFNPQTQGAPHYDSSDDGGNVVPSLKCKAKVAVPQSNPNKHLATLNRVAVVTPVKSSADAWLKRSPVHNNDLHVAQLFRSASAQNPPTVIRQKPRGVEDLKHSLHKLKIELNQCQEENTKLKTLNTQLETLIQQLYNDIETQQSELQKLYQGKKGVKSNLLQQAANLGLKRQLREARQSHKAVTEELDTLRKSLKMTAQAELSLQMQIYQDECTRLRALLEQELALSQQNVAVMAQNHINILSITSEEDRRRIQAQFQRMQSQLQEAQMLNQQLTKQIEDLRKKPVMTALPKRANQNDLQTRQAKLIQQKVAQIKLLTDQVQSQNAKIQTYDRVISRNLDLTKQVADLQRKLAGASSPGEKLSSKPLSHKMRQSLKQFNEGSPEPTIADMIVKDPLIRARKQLARQMTETVTEEQRRLDAQIKEKAPDSQYPNSPSAATHVDKAINKVQLLIQGLNCFRDLFLEKQPSGEFYQANRLKINKLNSRVKRVTLKPKSFKLLLQDRVQVAPGADIADQVQECVTMWTQAGLSEMQVCKAVLTYLLPCIQGTQINTKRFYENLELVNTHSDGDSSDAPDDDNEDDDESIEFVSGNQSETPTGTQGSQPLQSLSLQVQRRPSVIGPPVSTNSQFKPLTVLHEENVAEDESPPPLPKQKSAFDASLPYASVTALKEIKDSESGESVSDFTGRSKSNNASEVATSANKQSHQSLNISEERMLDTAEKILTQLAQVLISRNWTVFDVFAQPPQIIRVIPEFEGDLNVAVLDPHIFLGRLYQAGFDNLTPLEVSCLMQVLSKPDFDDVVRYDELEAILEHFGVQSRYTANAPPNPDVYEDDFNDSQMSEGKLNIVEDESPSDNLERVVNSQLESEKPLQVVSEASGDVVFINDNEPRPDFEFNKKDSSHHLKIETSKPQEQSKEIQNSLLQSQPSENRNFSVQNLNSPVNCISLDTPINIRESDRNACSDLVTPEFKIQKFEQQDKKSAFQSAVKKVSTFNKITKICSTQPQAQTIQEEDQDTSQAAEPKNGRLQLRRQITQDRCNISSLVKDILSKHSLALLMDRLRQQSYPQTLQSTSRKVETLVITKDCFFEVINGMTDVRLSEKEMTKFSEAVHVTPQYDNIYTLKLIQMLVKDLAAELQSQQQKQT